MSANDYYNPTSRQNQTPQPYYQSYNPQPPPLSGPPSYHSQTPSLHPSLPSRNPSVASPVSPFEAPFDDHVYPAGGLDGQHRMDSQSTLGADSRYYGQGGGGRQDSLTSFRDDIPLRDHPRLPPKSNVDMNDHVYDAGDPTVPPHLMEEARPKRRSRLDFVKKPKGRIPWVTYILTTVQVAVFIAEIARNAVLTGSPIEIHPQFNPMIGPSPYIQINMGGRYMPCMHNVVDIQDSTIPIGWNCPNSTSNTAGSCTLSELCGFNGVPNPLYDGNINQKPEPNQWFRFIIPMFLHAGIIHIGFNMLLQMTLGREMEIAIGPIRYFLVYISSGIFGFVLGGNFAATGIVSTGASGSLFGVVALTLLDLLYTWRERTSPWKDLGFIMLDMVISFVLGLLPGLDNFSHIGGFLMGLVLGVCILRSPNALRARINQDEPPYTPVSQIKASDGDMPNSGFTGFVKNPVGFFQGRKGAWWAWWLVRAASLAAVFIIFILLLNNFYIYRKTCSWCKYLSCINVNNWCNQGNIAVTTTNTTSKRSVFDSWDSMAKLYEVQKRDTIHLF